MMKSLNITYLCLCLALVANLNTKAQTPFPTGLIAEDAVYDTLQRISNHGHSKAVLPPKIDLKPFCPKVKNQGDIYSCVGWATGYAAMSIEQAIDKGWTDEKIITDSAYSALFVYNHVKMGEDCQQGARISDAIHFLQQRGNLKAMQFDFNLNDCQKKGLDFQWKSAKTHRIVAYETLFDRAALESIKVQQVKRALSGQLTATGKPKPVIIGMSVRQNFYELRNARFWWPDKGNVIPAGGHAMTVVGYDDDLGAFQLFNSWGKSWGDLGLIWVKYEDFAKFCKYAYLLRTTSDEFYEKKNRATLVLNIKSSPTENSTLRRNPNTSSSSTNAPVATAHHKKPNTDISANVLNQKPSTTSNQLAVQQEEVRALRELEGAFEFRTFEGFGGSNEPIFTEAAVTKTGIAYETVKKDWKVGDGFQLWLTTELNNAYLYVFSVNAENKIQVHWPRKESFNTQFSGMNESAYVINHAKVRIPGENKQGNQTILYIENAGTDHLVVLFATKEIRSFKSICKKMQYRKDHLAEDLLQLLGNHAIPTADIDYHPDKMKFEVSTRSIGYIVPLVLKVDSW